MTPFVGKWFGRAVGAYALILILGLFAWNAGKQGLSDFYVQSARQEIESWSAPSRQIRGDEWPHAMGYLTESLRYAPTSAWALEEMGALQLRRMRTAVAVAQARQARAAAAAQPANVQLQAAAQQAAEEAQVATQAAVAEAITALQTAIQSGATLPPPPAPAPEPAPVPEPAPAPAPAPLPITPPVVPCTVSPC